jgi:hypothetical protein
MSEDTTFEDVIDGVINGYLEAVDEALDDTADTLEIFINKLCSGEPHEAVSEALCRVIAKHIAEEDDPSAAYEEFGRNIRDDICAIISVNAEENAA